MIRFGGSGRSEDTAVTVHTPSRGGLEIQHERELKATERPLIGPLDPGLSLAAGSGLVAELDGSGMYRQARGRA